MISVKVPSRKMLSVASVWRRSSTVKKAWRKGERKGEPRKRLASRPLFPRLVADGREGDLVLLEDPEKLRLLLSEYSL